MITIRKVVVGKTDPQQSDRKQTTLLGSLGLGVRFPTGECVGVWEYGRTTPTPVLSSQQPLAHGGEGGIRTPGTFRFTRFPSVRNRPLCHLSGIKTLGWEWV